MDDNATQHPARRSSAKGPQPDRPQPISPPFTATPPPAREPEPATDATPVGVPEQESDSADPAAEPRVATAANGAIRMRAGDPDRAKIAEILQDAVGKGQLTLAEFEERTLQTWNAVYLDELAPLTADLIPHQAAPHQAAPHHAIPDYAGAPHTAAGAPSAASRITGGEGPSFSMAIWSGFSRKGIWTVPRQFTAFTLMGGGELDLREAEYAAGEVTITAVAIMGGIEIIVPDDVHVHVSGIGFMGAFEDGRKWHGEKPIKPAADAPVVKINGLALMGGIEVVRKPFTQRRVERS